MFRSFNFTRVFLLKALRMVVSMALSWGRLHHAEMQRLLSIAIYRELTDRGLNQNQIGAFTGVSNGNVSNWKDWSEHPKKSENGPTMVERILNALNTDKANSSLDRLIEYAKEKKWYAQGRFDRAISFLVKLKWVEAKPFRGDTLLVLTELGTKKSPRFGEIYPDGDQVFNFGMTIVYHVHLHGSATQKELDEHPRFGGHADDGERLNDALELMVDEGALEKEGEGPEAIYKLSSSLVDLKGADFQVGLLRLIHRFGRYFEEMQREQDDTLLSHKVFTLNIRQEDVSKMLKEKFEAIVRILEIHEYKGLIEDADEDVIQYHVMNLGSPLRVRTRKGSGPRL